jgi:hypothetical protein
VSIEKSILEEEYESLLAQLEARALFPGFSLEDIEMELQALLIYQGQDWGGRGALKNAEIQGHIYAYEVFLKRYKDKKN